MIWFVILILFLVFISLIVYYIYSLKQLNNKHNYYKQELDNKQTSENNNILTQLPIRQFLENRDRNVLYDPLVAPERRVDINNYPLRIQNTINIPTRGHADNFQLMGIANRNRDETNVQIFGRATYPGSNQYEYYVINSEDGFKLPFATKGNKELLDGDIIDIPQFNKHRGPFTVKLYNYNTPRYNPFV